MREILFRGKRTDTGEWVYGSLIRMDDGGYQTFIFPPYNKASSRSCGQLVAYGMIAVIPETVGQYTGLKDKNGVEIYEGDIIEKTYYSYHQPECSEIFKIIYNGLGFSFEHIKGRSYHTPFTEEIEVIGNVHDNPELVED